MHTVQLQPETQNDLVFINLMKLKCCFTSIETVGLLGTGAQDGHLDFRTAPELCHQSVKGVINVVQSRLVK